MPNNEINTDGITAIVCCIKANEASALRELDLSVRLREKSIEKGAIGSRVEYGRDQRYSSDL